MSDPVTPRRFVVLRHHPGRGSTRSSSVHFDWMFECDGQLRTWATVTWDLDDPTEREWECEPLAPHRLHYLDYEGSVSGDRGFVERVISGTYVHATQKDVDLSASLHWESEVGLRNADIRIYRSLDPVSAASADEMRTSWALRFSPGW